MKTATSVELAAAPRPVPVLRVAELVRPADYLELCKPEVTSLIVIATGISFCMASYGSLRLLALFHTVFGTMLIAAGTAALNQYVERASDALMKRTMRRPLPAGRVTAGRALVFGSILVAAGALYLAWTTNLLACFLALLTFVTYLFVYTPLKKRSPVCTTAGAFPGALPALIGWAAAAGRLEAGAWILYGVLFLWQFPHFMAIAWLYREEYGRAGIRMLPVVEPDGRSTVRQILVASVGLILVSALPYFAGMARAWYLPASLAIGLAFLWFGVRLARRLTLVEARRLLHASVVYLPLLYAFLLLARK